MRRFLALALSLILVSGCAPAQPVDADLSQPPTQSQQQPDPPPPPEPEPEPEPEPIVSHLMVGGDIMSHMPLTNDCYVKETDSYDYTHVLRDAAEQLALADFAVGNLETTLAGGPEYSGYPRFNSPDELAYNIKDAGFDLLCTTNNHCLDKGIDGLNRTLDVLDEAGLPHVGTYRSQEERDADRGIYVADVGGISVAFLAYTYGLNGHRLPDSKPYAASIFNTDYYTSVSNPDYGLIEADMAAARALDTDLDRRNHPLGLGVPHQAERPSGEAGPVPGGAGGRPGAGGTPPCPPALRHHYRHRRGRHTAGGVCDLLPGQLHFQPEL